MVPERWLNSLPDAAMVESHRALRHIVMIDEAHLVLSRKLAALDKLIRLSRSKGGVVMLLSQSPDDFGRADQDFLANMGAIVAFRGNAKPAAVQHLFGRAAGIVDLAPGECIARIGGSIRRVTAFVPRVG